MSGVIIHMYIVNLFLLITPNIIFNTNYFSHISLPWILICQHIYNFGIKDVILGVVCENMTLI